MNISLSTILLIIGGLLLSGCGGSGGDSGDSDNGQVCTTKYKTDYVTHETSSEQSIAHYGNILIGTNTSCGEHLQVGTPKVSDQLLCRDAFAVGYNYSNKSADWVSYSLTDISVNGSYPRSNYFVSDKELPEHARSTPEDYYNSGYDRGHLAPAATIDYSENAMQQSFLMSNIIPQNSTLNRGLWAKLEEWVRDCAVEKQSLQVFTGTINNAESTTINGGVKVPEYLYKVIVKLESPSQAVAFLIPNTAPTSSDLKEYITDIKTIESMTDSSFLNNLNGDIASKLRGMTSDICKIDDYDGNVILTTTEAIQTPYEDCASNGSCCRVCTTGKACGDSCISKTKTCHKTGGCACNG